MDDGRWTMERGTLELEPLLNLKDWIMTWRPY
jgi:hypothetical protein